MTPVRSYEPGGTRELVSTAYPLILSTASSTVRQFVNRVFLAHYGPDELAACVPVPSLRLGKSLHHAACRKAGSEARPSRVP